MYSIYTETIIEAWPDKVWAVLSDYDKLSEWSPGPTHFEGEFRKDGPAKVTFPLGIGSMTQVFEHALIHFEEGRMFGWSTPLPNMHMKDNHKYICEPVEGNPNQTRFVQTDALHGQGSHYMGCMVARALKYNYVAFNRALKKRVEETL